MRLWRNMVSFFLTDEELGKKDDDHKRTTLPLRAPQWNAARVSRRRTVKRLLIALIIGLVVYVFVANIPTDLPIRDRRRPTYEYTNEVPYNAPRPTFKSNRPPKKHHEPVKETAEIPSYNGPVRFPALSASLYAISATRGGYTTNKNVLFAAASLKSAATLLPMACQMGSELRSYVHFALLSRSEIDVDELRAINGIDPSCQVIFHDARTEYSAISTDARLENGVTRALNHIHMYMHPQAVIIDGSNTEETFLHLAMRTKTHSLNIPLIELPKSAPNHLAWMTKLDSASLAAWNKVNVDIIIQAPPGGAGSLIRLLRSLSRADFTSLPIPHLTIELPHKVDLATTKFLEKFQWPPRRVGSPSHVNQLSLRRRISRQTMREEESAVRFLESFWPANPHDSHVLVLAPNAEVSPQFMHYLTYSLLEYKYSNSALLQEWDRRLLGISLDLPATYLNASEPFSPPTKKDVAQPMFTEPSTTTPSTDGPTSFLWQAPNSNAVLFFGQRWVELHGFISRLVEFQHKSPSSSTPSSSILSEKLINKKYPAWLEYALKLSRARGYWTLYPSEVAATNLATIHNELFIPPEEYEAEGRGESGGTEVTLAAAPLLDRLPNGGSLPGFDQLPLLTWDGEATKLRSLDASAAEYTKDFRRIIGGCEDLLASDLIPGKSAADLFCSKDA